MSRSGTLQSFDWPIFRERIYTGCEKPFLTVLTRIIAANWRDVVDRSSHSEDVRGANRFRVRLGD